MSSNNFRFLFIFLLVGFISGCMSLADKRDMEELRAAVNLRATIIQGGEYWPCCMLISIAGEHAKEIFSKMPDNTLLTLPTKGTCLDGDVVKVSEGTICIARESKLDDPDLYSCKITMNYATGATQKVDVQDYLNCYEEE
ncbi:MAG: hypothetical protein LBE78_03175 [Burkholderiaceae bacterium]|nr:hypothetical protein [Burkholderiaceae bacterium]